MRCRCTATSATRPLTTRWRRGAQCPAGPPARPRPSPAPAWLPPRLPRRSSWPRPSGRRRLRPPAPPPMCLLPAGGPAARAARGRCRQQRRGQRRPGRRCRVPVAAAHRRRAWRSRCLMGGQSLLRRGSLSLMLGRGNQRAPRLRPQAALWQGMPAPVLSLISRPCLQQQMQKQKQQQELMRCLKMQGMQRQRAQQTATAQQTREQRPAVQPAPTAVGPLRAMLGQRQQTRQRRGAGARRPAPAGGISPSGGQMAMSRSTMWSRPRRAHARAAWSMWHAGILSLRERRACRAATAGRA